MSSTNFQHPRDYLFFPALFFTIKYYICLTIFPPTAVVEMLAAGLSTVAHRSGGPLMDIVSESPEQSRNGFLAVTEEEYADTLMQVGKNYFLNAA